VRPSRDSSNRSTHPAGLDWIGRGEVWRIEQEATIAAFQAFLARWEAEDD
jgi:hypothetical protein